MKLETTWSPRLGDGDGSPCDRLIAALTEDVAAGRIVGGDRLPAHRDLAWRLGVGLGSVTKAYRELERRGLVVGVHGRGTFVAGPSGRPSETIDLSLNVPPLVLGDRFLAAALTALVKKLDAESFSTYAPPAGRADHRALMARRLAAQGVDATAERVFLTHGAQHALSVAFATLVGATTPFLTETTTYPGALLWTRQAGIAPIGVAVDAEGMRPDALADRLASVVGRGRPVVYVTPTVHNPTTATMGEARRRAVAEVARRHDAMIVEDDVHSIFAPAGLPPIAACAPERVFHVGGLSKTLSPGLRIGALTTPPGFARAAGERLQATSSTASPLSSRIMEQWLGDGTADAVADAIRRDARERRRLAGAILPAAIGVGEVGGFHVWLPKTVVEAEAFVARAAATGILLLPARAPLSDPAAKEGGVRISLGGPSIDALERALRRLADIAGGGFEATV
ncbi:MAG: PLP-dependent aminotransferase family protein [Hyphomicrobiales bacterium]|nr:PLP-dependent aminotransferase family protein [Hyphomicrobiales bacterium]